MYICTCVQCSLSTIYKSNISIIEMRKKKEKRRTLINKTKSLEEIKLYNEVYLFKTSSLQYTYGLYDVSVLSLSLSLPLPFFYV